MCIALRRPRCRTKMRPNTGVTHGHEGSLYRLSVTRLLLISICMLVTGALQADPPPESDSETGLDLRCRGCNVLFLNLDFLRADRVGPRARQSLTPNIDDYFANSIQFEDVSSPAGSSYRGNLSVLTGTDPHWYALDVHTYARLRNHHELGPWKRVYMARPTIGEVLSSAGYHTIYLNKGHRSGKETLLHRGFTEYQDFRLQTLFEDLVPALQSSLAAAPRPFFLLFHAIPTRLHTPYYPLDRPRKRGDHIIYTKYKMGGKDYGYKVKRNRKVPLERQHLAEQEIYDQQLEYADEQLGDVFASLRRLERDTIIVFYSNHGTQLGDKGIFASNGVSYQQCVQVPLFIKHPKVKRQLRVKTAISLIDLVATIYDMLGVKGPDAMDAESLVPVIQGQQYHRQFMVGLNDPDGYIREGYWKLIVRPRGQHQLFNTRTDPALAHNRFHFEGGRGKMMLYKSNFMTPSIDEVRDGEWLLKIDRAHALELYDLKNDPLETNDLSTRFPEITASLASAFDENRRRVDERRRIRVKQH